MSKEASMIRRRLILFFFLLVTVSLNFPAREVPGATGATYRKTIEVYNIPDVTLINQEGKKVRLKKILSTDKPVLVDFVYTTCTTICPVLSANFVNFQRKKGPEAGKIQLVSISIDPENDTPKTMKAYLKRYGAKQGWDFLTGSREDMDKVIRAFNALNGTVLNKMDHLPIILIKSPADHRWVRINGLIGTTELIKIYEEASK
jgi:protein SCO1/2